MTKRLSGDEKLLRDIGRAIRRADCRDTSIVESLISCAAGIAADKRTHCLGEFTALAHNMYHGAEDVLEQRDPPLEGVGGFQN